MDAEALRKKRKEEIEEKKRRLEEIRKSVQQQQQQSAPAISTLSTEKSTSNSVPASESKVENKSSLDTDALVSSLLNKPSESKSISKEKDSSYSESINTPSSTLVSSSTNYIEKSKRFVTVKSNNAIQYLPIQTVTYEKECQTEEDDQFFLNEGQAEDDDFFIDTNAPISATDILLNSVKKSARRLGPGGSALKHQPSWHPLNDSNNTGSPMITKQLSEDDLDVILTDKSFLSFLETSSLRIERALVQCNNYDLLKDYSQDLLSKEGSHRSAFQIMNHFEEESLKNRPVMDIKWSPSTSELFLIAYGAKSHQQSTSKSTSSSAQEMDEPPGMVCIWSIELSSRPEFKFSSSSPVLTALFHNGESQMVIGGCYNGQILLWDMRTKKTLPIQRSSLTGKGHKHPVYAMGLSGTPLTSELVTISVDGMLCHWDISRLTEPISISFLSFNNPRSNSFNPSSDLSNLLLSPQGERTSSSPSSLNISSMAISHNENANFLIVGSGIGQLLKATLPYKPSQDKNIKQVEAHVGLITSIQLHPSPTKYKHLLLTCSLDWTIKLWNMNSLNQPLFEFMSPSCDYVCDAQWSPIHPGVFLTITSSGKLQLWNLCKQTTKPVDILDLSKELEDPLVLKGASMKNIQPAALNKAVFSKDGEYILVGDSIGKILRIKLNPTEVIPSVADENKLDNLLSFAVSSSSLFSNDSPIPSNANKTKSILLDEDDEELEQISTLDLNKEVL